MARARNIKPGLFKNELLGAEDPLLTILFASLWCLADREGRLEDRPNRIRAETFAYRPDVSLKLVDDLLTNLHIKGFITRYKVGETQVIQVIKFSEHQNPHHREKKSCLPPLGPEALILKDAGENPGQAQGQALPFPVVKRPDSLIPDSLIPDSFKRMPRAKTNATAVEKTIDLDFENFWRLYPKRPGGNKTQAAKAWAARMKEREDVQQILYGTKRYRDYCIAMGIEPKFIKQASTFIGPDKHYRSDWAVGKSGPMKPGGFLAGLTGRKHDSGIIDINPDDIEAGD